jgi:hypothetical protein
LSRSCFTLCSSTAAANAGAEKLKKAYRDRATMDVRPTIAAIKFSAAQRREVLQVISGWFSVLLDGYMQVCLGISSARLLTQDLDRYDRLRTPCSTAYERIGLHEVTDLLWG